MPPASPLAHRRPRRERAGQTRRVILAAAARIFAGTGLAGARIDAIAAAAGVNKALLYYYFQSKDDLYLAVLEDQFREFNRQAIEILNGDEPHERQIRAFRLLTEDFSIDGGELTPTLKIKRRVVVS